MPSDQLAVELRALHKTFGSVQANAGIHLKVRRGSIHAVIGENGAGKSTAMKMLYGVYSPDSGEILVAGGAVKFRSPRDAIHAGIGMVHQHFMLAEPYSALENVILGSERSRPGWNWLPPLLRPVDRARARDRLRKLSSDYGFKVDWDANVEALPVGVQQRIEILKLLYHDASTLILDEPTAVLTPQEISELFVQLRVMASQGKSVLIITHKLKEVLALADQVTVFRAGRVVGEREVAQTNADELADLMVGRKVNLTAQAPPKAVIGEPVCEMRDLALEGSLRELNLCVRGGEVVGIAGVEGNGQSELLNLLLHARDRRKEVSGSFRIFGRDATELTADEIKRMGVGFIPEDRHREGLMLDRPVSENFLLGLQRRAPFAKRGFISRENWRAAASRALEAYDVRPRSLEVNARGLSGGNQQKLIIAREFEKTPRFLVAAQPTRGVDVGAIESIHQRILAARTSGTGVLLVSSELDEILALADRILVMYGGRFVAEFARGQADERKLGLSMSGSAAGRAEGSSIRPEGSLR